MPCYIYSYAGLFSFQTAAVRCNQDQGTRKVGGGEIKPLPICSYPNENPAPSATCSNGSVPPGANSSHGGGVPIRTGTMARAKS